MEMFSNCSGKCCICANSNGCIAGHGDDYFLPAPKEQVIEYLNKGWYPYYTEYMVQYLASEFGYVYNVKREENEKGSN